MSDPILGEIRMFGGYYAPQDWHLCDGSQLPISSNEALYSLIGTTYGGDGTSNFALPDLRGRLPIGQGQGTGLTPRVLAQSGGREAAPLAVSQMPAHTHAANAVSTAGTQTNPQGGVCAATVNATTSPAAAVNQYIQRSEIKPTDKTGEMDPLAIGAAGGSVSHANMMPYLTLNFIICVNGIYPTPSE
ncbi:MAG: tail fiber protein [Geobacteraceae bacterium]|nr:tail fiber protein [Geobacteraceae bacterium]